MRRIVNWKIHLRGLELNKQWDQAIEFMQIIIGANPDDMHAYIYMNFLLMNLLVEEDYDESRYDYYTKLTKKYFDESYVKFFNYAEYLFCTGITAVMSEWYFGLDADGYQTMLARAAELEPDNMLYKRGYYIHLDRNIVSQLTEAKYYAHLILQNNSTLTRQLKSYGALSEYLYCRMRGWANDTLSW